MNGKERRAAKRISYICEVECQGAGVSRLQTRINDLSVTGLFIDSMTAFAVGTVLKLKFRVQNHTIETTAEVRYSMPQIGMGVRFLDLTPEHHAVIESFVEGKPLVLPTAPAQPPASFSSSSAGSEKALLGNFAVVSLFDVIQMIENSHLTGALIISSRLVDGEIRFNDGQIADAVAGPFRALDALNKFLGASEGTFEFKKSSAEYECTIKATSNTGLLLDLLATKDEENAFS